MTHQVINQENKNELLLVEKGKRLDMDGRVCGSFVCLQGPHT
jgi:hypothetical protein